MFGEKSIRKATALMRSAYALMSEKSVNEIKMCLSSGNRKIGRVMNVSLPPIITCGNCAQCARYCYDIKACLQYPETVIDARIRNYSVLMQDRDEYFHRIGAAMTRRRKNKYFRWHVGGEIPDYDYFDRMVKNAAEHPDFIIWTYTKRYDIINAWVENNGLDAIPNNFTIMFSEWDGTPMNNPYHFPEFTCQLKNGNKNHPAEYFKALYTCPGNCDICKNLNRGCIAGETTKAIEH